MISFNATRPDFGGAKGRWEATLLLVMTGRRQRLQCYETVLFDIADEDGRGAFAGTAEFASKLKMLLIEAKQPNWPDQLSIPQLRTVTEMVLACTATDSAAVNPGRLEQAEDLRTLQIQFPLASTSAAGLHARIRFIPTFISSVRGEAQIRR